MINADPSKAVRLLAEWWRAINHGRQR